MDGARSPSPPNRAGAGNPGPRSIRERLRRETAREHAALEDRLELTDPLISVERYVAVLSAFYGFYAPLESRLRHAARQLSVAPGFALPERAELLAGDLGALGLSRADVERLPTCTELPAVAGDAQFAGCLYVLEGASLGGQLVARALWRRDDPRFGRATAFFAGDGALTGRRFRIVIDWLDRLVREGASSDELVSSARATFGDFARWLALRGLGP